MPISLFDHRRIRQAIILVLLTGTLLCIFPVNNPYAIYWASNSVFVCLGYLVIGLLFFLLNRKHLMFVCMGCCAAICLYYLEISPDQPNYPKEKAEQNMPGDSLSLKKRPAQ